MLPALPSQTVRSTSSSAGSDSPRQQAGDAVDRDPSPRRGHLRTTVTPTEHYQNGPVKQLFIIAPASGPRAFDRNSGPLSSESGSDSRYRLSDDVHVNLEEVFASESPMSRSSSDSESNLVDAAEFTFDADSEERGSSAPGVVTSQWE